MSGGLDWETARERAGRFRPLPVRSLPLARAVGGVAAAAVTAPRPIPHYDSAAMDGWAVAGAPPWRLGSAGDLGPGRAAGVVTGGLVPAAADGIVPLERGEVVDGLLHAEPPRLGAHIRRAGEEAPAGTVLVAAGEVLGPAAVAVLAVAGFDAVPARGRPVVAALLTGDEVVASGAPEPGRVRDAFDPLLPLAVAGLGGSALSPVRLRDDPAALAAAIAAGSPDVVLTVGGTGRSSADRLREALRLVGAEPVFDGVAMRPGHPVLLARLPGGRPLLGLPGNPLAAVAALLSFLPPVLAALTGLPAPEPLPATAAVPIPGVADGVALVPCRRTPRGLEPAAAARPNMLRGLAASDVLAVVPPEGSGAPLRALPLPW